MIIGIIIGVLIMQFIAFICYFVLNLDEDRYMKVTVGIYPYIVFIFMWIIWGCGKLLDIVKKKNT